MGVLPTPQVCGGRMPNSMPRRETLSWQPVEKLKPKASAKTPALPTAQRGVNTLFPLSKKSRAIHTHPISTVATDSPLSKAGDPVFSQTCDRDLFNEVKAKLPHFCEDLVLAGAHVVQGPLTTHPRNALKVNDDHFATRA